MIGAKSHHALGTHPPQCKHTEGMAFVDTSAFQEVSLPLDMQIGPGCKALVKRGDHVNVGQKIGEPLGPWSVPVHASVSGTVTSVKKDIMSDGNTVNVVVIESDGHMTRDPSIVPPVVTDKASLLTAIREAGLVGLGGAAFPTHIKLDPPPDKTIDTLIINGAECEPYITSDDGIMRLHADRVVAGVDLVCRHLHIPHCIIAIEDNKREALRTVKTAVKAHTGDVKIDVRAFKTLYPTGAEKVLIRYATGRIVLEGKLPADVGVIVMNVGTVAFIAEYVRTGVPLIQKYVTVDGSALTTCGNYTLPIGARIADVLQAVGGAKKPIGKIIMGGPMMGIAIDDITQPILKQTNALLFFDEHDATIPKESACIACGRCVRHCPMRLMPASIDNAARREDLETLHALHVMNCIECGCCAFVCPAKRYLVQNIRIGKNQVRAAQRAARARAKEA